MNLWNVLSRVWRQKKSLFIAKLMLKWHESWSLVVSKIDLYSCGLTWVSADVTAAVTLTDCKCPCRSRNSFLSFHSVFASKSLNYHPADYENLCLCIKRKAPSICVTQWIEEDSWNGRDDLTSPLSDACGGLPFGVLCFKSSDWSIHYMLAWYDNKVQLWCH